MFLSERSLQYRLQKCAVFLIEFSLMHQVVYYYILKTTVFLLSELFGVTKQIAVEEKAVQVAANCQSTQTCYCLQQQFSSKAYLRLDAEIPLSPTVYSDFCSHLLHLLLPLAHSSYFGFLQPLPGEANVTISLFFSDSNQSFCLFRRPC